MKQCSQCKTIQPLEQFHKHRRRPDGLETRCKQCMRKNNGKHNPRRMMVNGVYIPISHPLHKPGNYKTLTGAWTDVEIDSKTASGSVYVMSNPAWVGWHKVGKAVIDEDRLKNYQTSSPYRDYKMLYSKGFNNRSNAEAYAHQQLRAKLREEYCRNEWFYTELDVIIDIINSYVEEKQSNEETNAGHRDEPSPQYDLDLCN